MHSQSARAFQRKECETLKNECMSEKQTSLNKISWRAETISPLITQQQQHHNNSDNSLGKNGKIVQVPASKM